MEVIRRDVSDVLGQSGRAILEALIAGESDPDKLTDLARGTARQKRSELIQALHGRIRAHHRGLLKVHLELVAALEQALLDIDAAVGKNLAPIQHSAGLLTTMPGISEVTAHLVVAYHTLKNGVEYRELGAITSRAVIAPKPSRACCAVLMIWAARFSSRHSQPEITTRERASY